MDIHFIIAVIAIVLIALYLFVINIFIKIKIINETTNKLYFDISKINSVINNINEETVNNYKLIKTNADSIRNLRDVLQYYINSNDINNIDNIRNVLNTINKNVNAILLTNNDTIKIINNNTNNIIDLKNALILYIDIIKCVKANTNFILLNVDKNANMLKKIISELDTDKPNCKDRVHTKKKVKAKNSLSNSKDEQTINNNNKK